jgi:hypothetical protein
MTTMIFRMKSDFFKFSNAKLQNQILVEFINLSRFKKFNKEK